MSESCDWCNSSEIQLEKKSVFWELPDGTRAIEIEATPTIVCRDCGMNYQEEQVIKEIEDQLFLVDTKEIEKAISFPNLLKLPRLLKRNYFDFS